MNKPWNRGYQKVQPHGLSHVMGIELYPKPISHSPIRFHDLFSCRHIKAAGDEIARTPYGKAASAGGLIICFRADKALKSWQGFACACQSLQVNALSHSICISSSFLYLRLILDLRLIWGCSFTLHSHLIFFFVSEASSDPWGSLHDSSCFSSVVMCFDWCYLFCKPWKPCLRNLLTPGPLSSFLGKKCQHSPTISSSPRDYFQLYFLGWFLCTFVPTVQWVSNS